MVMDPQVNAVKAVLRPGQAGGQHGAPLCREGHFQQLMQFLTAAHGKDQGSSAYVTGLPGTGKSVTVHATARQWNEQICKGKSGSAITPRLISINCMSLTQPREVLARILEGVQAQPLPSLLYDLFQLPQAKGSRLVLLGISNSIDLTERVLPELRARGADPLLLPFASYSRANIVSLLNDRLAGLPGPVFSPPSLEFCARKIASGSGDMRRALESCSTAFATLCQNAASAHAERTAAMNTSGQTEAEQQAAAEAAAAAGLLRPIRHRVSIADMAAGLSAVTGGVDSLGSPTSQAGTPAARKPLGQLQTSTTPSTSAQKPPSNQKRQRPMGMGLTPTAKRPRAGFRSPPGSCGSGFMSPPTARKPGALSQRHRVLPLGSLQDTYASCCHEVGMRPLAGSEFAQACELLASMGLLDVGRAPEERQRRVQLRVAEDDVVLGIHDIRVFQTCLGVQAPVAVAGV
ncbi:hypothetical protein WJX84_006599 [Apatococcus fuscideae]|uniref:Cell division control protein n=1 Tax=Apatococcus fuscideae TaxID=2026836 RepID=A0AAW1SL25_9CHLO